MPVMLIGDQLVGFDGRERGVDIRVFRWLHQWLSDDEAQDFISSLSRERLITLVTRYHRDIVKMPVWPAGELI